MMERQSIKFTRSFLVLNPWGIYIARKYFKGVVKAMAKEVKLQIRTSYEINRLAETDLVNAYEKLVPSIKYAIKENEKQCETTIDILNSELKMKGLSK
jgi:hypothetical protein